MNNQDTLKRQVAKAALEYVVEDTIIGIGTGSTVNYFIEALATIKQNIAGTVASSEASAQHLKRLGIPVVDLNGVDEVSVYVDGADEFNAAKQLIKGGGGALTREKIIAAVAKQFVCIVDESKRVDVLGAFPVPIEVIPMARSYIARQVVALGATPVYREGFVTDNGNVILDCHHFDILNAVELEYKLNQITGVVTNGLFAVRSADVVLVANQNGIQRL